MTQPRTDNLAVCPECEGVLQLSGKLHIGQKVVCRRCGSGLVISERKPLELVPAGQSAVPSGRGKANSNKGNSTVQSSPKQGAGRDGNDAPAKPSASTAICPECDVRITFQKPPIVGQLVTCIECEESLEVVSLRPVTLDWPDEDAWND